MRPIRHLTPGQPERSRGLWSQKKENFDDVITGVGSRSERIGRDRREAKKLLQRGSPGGENTLKGSEDQGEVKHGPKQSKWNGMAFKKHANQAQSPGNEEDGLYRWTQNKGKSIVILAGQGRRLLRNAETTAGKESASDGGKVIINKHGGWRVRGTTKQKGKG